MTQHNQPNDALQADLESLAEVFETEARADREQRLSAAVRAFPAEAGHQDIRRFADGGAAPRD